MINLIFPSFPNILAKYNKYDLLSLKLLIPLMFLFHQKFLTPEFLHWSNVYLKENDMCNHDTKCQHVSQCNKKSDIAME